ncbi:transglycosylase SLT domain-containing protein [Leucothrix pacifica]|uniref:Lytic murein transglycosylase n=1 Tax=Leucothrix pacifica TaxID=1247513 RepID=A0A317CP45_9GAMM|nr:transglycosylase SLT domain-containing protein [Leucothrix pacifica]PWR00235.1 hypothetical protein DKW60_03600 [Leucothrix pacifica]
MPVLRYSLICLILFAGQYSFAGEQENRDQFKSVYSKLKAGKSVDITGLKDYSLYPYLEYQQIVNNLKGTSTQSIEAFLMKHADSPLSEKLSESLMERYNNERQWGQTFTLYNEDNDSIKARCLHTQARIELGDTKNALVEGKSIWLSGRDRPKQCDALFKLLADNKQLSTEDYWERISLAMGRGATSLAKSLSRRLNKRDQALVKIWIQARSRPETALKKAVLGDDTAHSRDVIAYAIKRIARKDTSKAKTQFQSALKNYQFSIPQQAEINRYIAVRDALDHEAHSLVTLSSIPEEYRDDEANEWLVRIALREGDWKTVLDAVAAMPADKQEDSNWKYWKARALEAAKRSQEAIVLYKELSENASFYGFLAADHLGQPYTILEQRSPELDHLIPGLLEEPAIQRALELFELDMKTQARAEWFFALEKRNKLQMLAAAKLAQQRNHHFTAILTISRTKDWNQVELRFPMAYEKMIRQEAEAQAVHPALIYGVARRESAFDPNIVSSAKAQGLMQLIPSTAKQVSRSLGIKKLSKAATFDPETNIRLGARYLKTLLDKFDGNYALATASYNAGPHRMPRWRPDYPLEAARWIESIPYRETRNYVQAVMAYMTIYEYKLNGSEQKVKRLSQRLSPIKP